MKKTTKLAQNRIGVGSYFVGTWGYDQTQHSIYKVVKVAGNSTVYVEPKNTWGRLNNSDLAEGSKIKVYNYQQWNQLPEAERADLESRGWTWYDYQRHAMEEAKEAAAIVEIVKRERKDWTYVFTLSDGRKIDLSTTNDAIEQVRPLKKCIVNFKYKDPYIRIDDVISARLDVNYLDNAERYAEQNLYTSYNGR